MTFEEYQQETMALLMDKKFHRLPYYALGLAGESGEAIEQIKKMVRDDNDLLTDERREMIIKELGDVLWYISQMANVLDIPLSEIASKNVEKLRSRKDRGVQQGSGDNR